jgi:hypothetical protein
MQVDRVYVSSPNAVAVLDHEKKHSFVVKKEGLPDVGKICCPFPSTRKSTINSVSDFSL